jgi:hypothetical protein
MYLRIDSHFLTIFFRMNFFQCSYRKVIIEAIIKFGLKLQKKLNFQIPMNISINLENFVNFGRLTILVTKNAPVSSILDDKIFKFFLEHP